MAVTVTFLATFIIKLSGLHSIFSVDASTSHLVPAPNATGPERAGAASAAKWFSRHVITAFLNTNLEGKRQLNLRIYSHSSVIFL